MAVFDGHMKCVREQVQQLASPHPPPTELERKKNTVASSPVTSNPTFVDPKDVKLLGRVEGG